MFEIGDDIIVFKSDSILDGENGKVVGHRNVFDKDLIKVKLDIRTPIYLFRDYEIKHNRIIFSDVDPYGEENWD